jgi:hypothetical protein
LKPLGVHRVKDTLITVAIPLHLHFGKLSQTQAQVTIPASVTAKADKMQVWLIGENRYGRLKQRQDIAIISTVP